mmetsp:Transcript_7023/g.14958  ORF Transcript_7023/g.14958 Transcript_7023/m.14958 type:complete len:96 (+) Transcript_7023:497-784(+)
MTCPAPWCSSCLSSPPTAEFRRKLCFFSSADVKIVGLPAKRKSSLEEYNNFILVVYLFLSSFCCYVGSAVAAFAIVSFEILILSLNDLELSNQHF